MAEERLEEIRAQRLEKRAKLIEAGDPPYPAEVRRTHSLDQVEEHFNTLVDESAPLSLLGRITSLRKHGGLVFADLVDGSGSLQLQMTKDTLGEEAFNAIELIDAGDWVQAIGEVGMTNRGVKTLMVSEIHVVSKSIRPMPSEWYGLKDVEARYRERELDIAMNEKVRDAFVTRSRIIHWLREYMAIRGYLEVETPVLGQIAGGAAARPFTTHHNALDIDLYLRIASEIHLKRLLVGGIEKVFEIGTRFRNEGIDRQHNPEFTMLESQWAFADYEDLMDFTEETLEALVQDLLGTTEVTWQDHELSFKKPFARLRYVDVMSEKLGIDVLEEKDPDVYIKIFEEKGLELPEAQTYYQLLDELYKELVRPTLIQPTLVYDYPAEMVPLAKRSAQDPRVAEKFQTLIAGMEINNCYTELNDPVLQREAFERQMEARDAGDEEAQVIDEAYLKSMEYGMPPNAGWSLGIDRVTMLLTNSASIRDVVLFPLLRESND